MAVAADFAYLDWPGPIPFAHRGGASEVPENTLPAFAHAVGLGLQPLPDAVVPAADVLVVPGIDSPGAPGRRRAAALIAP